MNKYLYLLFAVLSILFLSKPAPADPMSELIEQYSKEYEAVKPEANSSVRADYKFDQMAMAGVYTTKTLSLMYQQNQEILDKQDEMLKKYDNIIEQNKKIIRLLTIISKQKEIITKESYEK